MVMMRQFKLQFLMGLSAAAVMANLDAGLCATAYEQAINTHNEKIASLLGGDQGIKSTSTPVERTNLTHIAIQRPLHNLV